ncbi:MAG: response regulator [Miltoncostaeaceae bacterium]
MDSALSPGVNGRPAEILLVEDDPADLNVALRTIAKSKVANNVHVARDGSEALRFVHREGDYAEAPRPDLILLDLNLPGVDGREVLEEIKLDSDLKTIPVVILTTSQADEDVKRAYENYASAYIRKPVDLGGFMKVVDTIENFWFSVVILPPT